MLDSIGDGTDVRPALKFVAEYPDPADLCQQARALAESGAALDDVTLVAIQKRAAD